jgi:hypothetical protein
MGTEVDKREFLADSRETQELDQSRASGFLSSPETNPFEIVNIVFGRLARSDPSCE